MRRSLFSHTPDSDLEVSTSPNQHSLDQPTDRLTDRPTDRPTGGKAEETGVNRRGGGEEKVRLGKGGKKKGKEWKGGAEKEGDL